MKQVAELIQSRFNGQCGIVYCNRTEGTSRLSLELKENGTPSMYFHGGIVDREMKLKHTNLWLDSDVDVMCATNAFGMRIDKADVRFVIHLSFPPSYEAKIQEFGRAGRDGADAYCILLYRFEDKNLHLQHISNVNMPDVRAKRLQSLNSFTKFLLDKSSCRQQLIVSHFGDSLEESCDKCDNCLRAVVHCSRDNTLDAKELVNCLQYVKAFKEKVTVEMLSMT